MKRSTVFVLLLFMTSAIILTPVGKVNAAANIYIRPDGNIDPSTAPILRSGNVYTLTSNVSSSIVIQKDGVMLDGAGYWINGTQVENTEAVEVSGRKDVTIKNLGVGSGFDAGILLENSSGIVVTDNSVMDVFTGISLKESSGNSIINNNIASVFNGVTMWKDCANNVISENDIEEVMQTGLEITSSGNVISGNTITGQTKRGWSPSEGIEMMSGVNNTLSGNIISHTFMAGIRVQRSSNNNILSNNIFNGGFSGISLESSDSNTVNGNSVKDCNAPDGGSGISVSDSSNNTLRGNNVSNNTRNFEVSGYSPTHWIHNIDSSNSVEGKPLYYWVFEQDKTVPSDLGYVILVNCTRITVESSAFVNKGQGLILAYSTNCTIARNTAANNCTVRLYSSSDNRITENTFTGNFRGLHTEYYCYNNIISGNNFTDNNYGFCLSSSSSNTITENNFINNSNGLYFSGSSSNNIYRNDFLNNTHHVYDAGINSPLASVKLTAAKTSSMSNSKPVTMRVERVNFVGPPPLSANSWDNGREGNFWSDYNGTDANGDGIGDTPYFIYGNNADNYPHIKPITIIVPELPFWAILPLFAVVILCVLAVRRKVLK